MADANLILHAGAERVSRDDLAAVPCPEAEGRWRPVGHAVVRDFAATALVDAGYSIEKEDLGLSSDKAKFFGTFTLRAPLSPGVNLSVGIRSSIDKSISLQWCAGSRVFVCDNLAFSSEIVIARKHTTHGVTRYQEAICKAVKGLGDYGRVEADRISRMKSTEINEER